MFFTVFR